MLSGNEQVHIGVGNFNQKIFNVNDCHADVLKHVAFQFLPRSCDAAFSAAINLDNLTRRSCTHGTRVDIIAQIMTWANETDLMRAPPVYWLTGLAGLGKTTIAYTICKLLSDARLPFTSFFCSLRLDSKNSKLIVTTLCRNLAELCNSYAANVLSILETNPKVVHNDLRIQIDELLAKPWQASMSQRRDRDIPIPIVVVDALDENDRGTEFLEEILRVIHAGQLAGIKFLVTSRPDPKIVKICKSFPPSAICKLHEIDTANVQSDIEKYLREALPDLKDEPELALLSQRAGGLFIYATTAVRFISPPYSPPSVSEMRSHLQTMLNFWLMTALSMWNQDSTIWRNWRDRFAFIPSISLPSTSITIPLVTIRKTGYVRCLAFSPDGNLMILIISGSRDSSVQVWNAKTGNQLKEMQGHTDEVRSVTFSPDGNQIVSGSRDNLVRVWDVKTGEHLKELQGHTYSVSSVWQPHDRSVQVWTELQGYTNCVSSLAFSLDGSQIVSGSWDAKTGEQLKVLQGHTNSVSSVTFSPDGNQIVSGSDDCSVRVWGNQILEAPWVVKEDEWIISGAERLVWAPSTICNVLLRPPTMLTMSRNGSAIISFAECKLGTLWHECYTPYCERSEHLSAKGVGGPDKYM